MRGRTLLWNGMIGLLMIGIDTNIILRFISRDDERHFALATDLISGATPENPLCVNVVTLVEAVWVLESRLKMKASSARDVMGRFVASAEIFLPESNPFSDPGAALASGHRGWTDVVVAQINREIGCDFTYTFDRRAARDVPGMELLE